MTVYTNSKSWNWIFFLFFTFRRCQSKEGKVKEKYKETNLLLSLAQLEGTSEVIFPLSTGRETGPQQWCEQNAANILFIELLIQNG